jgi:hypothetical protein
MTTYSTGILVPAHDIDRRQRQTNNLPKSLAWQAQLTIRTVIFFLISFVASDDNATHIGVIMSLRATGLMRRSTSNYDLPTTVRTHSHSPAPRSYNYNANGGYKSPQSRLRQNKLLVRAATAISIVSLCLYLGSSYLRSPSSNTGIDELEEEFA